MLAPSDLVCILHSVSTRSADVNIKRIATEIQYTGTKKSLDYWYGLRLLADQSLKQPMKCLQDDWYRYRVGRWGVWKGFEPNIMLGAPLVALLLHNIHLTTIFNISSTT